MVHLTLAQVKEKVLNWEHKMQIGSNDVVGRQVANYAGSGSNHNNHKRKSVRRVKSVRDIDQCFKL